MHDILELIKANNEWSFSSD